MNTTVLGCLAAAAAVTFAGAGSAGGSGERLRRQAGGAGFGQRPRPLHLRCGGSGREDRCRWLRRGRQGQHGRRVSVHCRRLARRFVRRRWHGGDQRGGERRQRRGRPWAGASRPTAPCWSPGRSRPIRGAPGNVGKDLDVAVLRLGPDGKLDAGFGEGGIAAHRPGRGQAGRRDVHHRQCLGTDGAGRWLCRLRGDAEPRAGPLGRRLCHRRPQRRRGARPGLRHRGRDPRRRERQRRQRAQHPAAGGWKVGGGRLQLRRRRGQPGADPAGRRRRA